MNVDLGSEKTITLVPAKNVELKNLTVVRMVDLPVEKKVFVIIQEMRSSPLILWEGDSYDSIGQWTDADVAARIIELLG